MQNITMILQRARIMVREMPLFLIRYFCRVWIRFLLHHKFCPSFEGEQSIKLKDVNDVFCARFPVVLQTALPLHAASLLARVLAFFSEYNLTNQKQFITLNYWPCFFTGWSQVEYRTDPTSVAELSQLRSAPGISSSGDECDSISWLKNCNFFFHSTPFEDLYKNT